MTPFYLTYLLTLLDMSTLFCVLIWFIILLSHHTIALTPDDYLIKSLPLYNGTFSDIPFKMYSGYMALPDEDQTSLFFMFVESQNDPSSDPLIMWNNGGPGASSVEFGFWQEHGPFKLQKFAFGVNSNLKYAWNKIANVIYLDSPSGVGYSYSNKTSGYNCSDDKTKQINFMFLNEFFKVFTSFNKNTFYLVGESYSGHYTTELAYYIIQQNKVKDFNLKGILLGNPRSANDGHSGPNYWAFLTYLWSHGLLPQTAYLQAYKACNWTGFIQSCNNTPYENPTQECINACNKAFEYIPTNGYDYYDIYAPTCHQQPSSNTHHHFSDIGDEGFDNDEYDPCYAQYIPQYMNRQDVLQAFHAIDGYDRIYPDKPSGWQYGSQLNDITLLFPTLLSQDPQLRITVTTGDADTAEPFLQAITWINCLNRTVVKDFSNWFMDGDVAGSVKIYDGITYQTVKHCGHLLPTYCPKQGFQYFFDYINGTYSSP